MTSVDLQSEALAIRERAYRSAHRFSATNSIRRTLATQGLPPVDKKAVASAPKHVECSGALVDEGAVLGLVKLLYLEEQLPRGVLQHILLNISGFEENRKFLVETLMQILSAIPSHSSQEKLLSSEGGYSPNFNPISLPQHPLLGYKQGGRYSLITDHPPQLVIRRVLDLLTYLVKGNPRVPLLLTGTMKVLSSTPHEHQVDISREKKKQKLAEASQEYL